jgi:hypothetical protein
VGAEPSLSSRAVGAESTLRSGGEPPRVCARFAQVPAMNPVRKLEHSALMNAALGKNKTAWLESAMHFWGGLNNIFRFGPFRYAAYYVDEAWVAAEKAKHKQRHERIQGSAAAATTTPPFVSTNDVLMSWWLTTGG